MYIYIQSAFSEEHLYNIRNKFSDENGNNSIFSNNCINCANNVEDISIYIIYFPVQSV